MAQFYWGRPVQQAVVEREQLDGCVLLFLACGHPKVMPGSTRQTYTSCPLCTRNKRISKPSQQGSSDVGSVTDD